MVQQSWSLIIFAFNEEKSIQDVIEKSCNLLQQIAPNNHELIIVEDGSTDNTLQIIESCVPHFPSVYVVKHKVNQGIGKALLSGYHFARCENVCAIPADGQFDVNELIPYANVPKHTFISFYRIEKTRYTPYRKLLSFGNKFFNKHFLGIKIKDVNWIKIYKKQFFDEIKPVLTSSLVESEICAKMIKNNYSVIEVQSKYLNRNGGISKGASMKTLLKAIFEILKLFFEIRFKK